ncbi:hypothetical protein RUM43_006222 [Polyplax serrata]|uniref:Uncharacterized protein n=1 Tax=Polyplax serrata TaxID=468196 RepID=A0AAN8NSU6_POLSC
MFELLVYDDTQKGHLKSTRSVVYSSRYSVQIKFKQRTSKRRRGSACEDEGKNDAHCSKAVERSDDNIIRCNYDSVVDDCDGDVGDDGDDSAIAE